MYATLTLPAGHDASFPARTCTVRVRSAEDLRNALRHAREKSVRLDGSEMDRVLRLDAARGLIEVQAATTWAELAAYLGARELPIDTFGGSHGMPGTVGEAVSRAAAGPDGLPVTAHVAAITLFMPDGELRRADRDANGELFRLILGGQGVIGLLYSVTLSIPSLRSSASAATEPAELTLASPAIPQARGCSIECLLPPEALEPFLAQVRALAEERRISLHAISVRRYRADPDAMLAWATREWAGVEIRFAVKPTLGASVGAAEVRRALLALALEQGGSFPICDLRDATRRQLEACYPRVRRFVADKRRSDPGERLQNAWYRDLLATLRSMPCAVRWERIERGNRED